MRRMDTQTCGEWIAGRTGCGAFCRTSASPSHAQAAPPSSNTVMPVFLNFEITILEPCELYVNNYSSTRLLWNSHLSANDDSHSAFRFTQWNWNGFGQKITEYLRLQSVICPFLVILRVPTVQCVMKFRERSPSFSILCWLLNQLCAKNRRGADTATQQKSAIGLMICFIFFPNHMHGEIEKEVQQDTEKDLQ